MNIKQAEEASRIQKSNLRFYEKEGLVVPKRNKENDYREYSEEDIQTLKMIRMLRMIDMPLEQIKDIINGKISMEEAAAKQRLLLKEREKELETAIYFCDELEKCAKKNELNVDLILEEMERPENKADLFKQWIEDYKKIAKIEQAKTFVFYPESVVTNPTEFTLALCQYAEQNNLDIVITKEGMNPEFTIDGMEYTAETYYRTVHHIPTLAVRCRLKDAEMYEADIPKERKRILKGVYYIWILILLLAICWPIFTGFSWGEMLQTWQGKLKGLAVLIVAGISIYRFIIFYYNERG